MALPDNHPRIPDSRVGVLIVNLGTPDGYDVKSMRRYLGEFLSDRRVIWTFLDGRCQHGEWYMRGSHICFIYEDNPNEQCWSFTRKSAGLIARFENDPEALELYEVEKTSDSLTCIGPDVGA